MARRHRHRHRHPTMAGAGDDRSPAEPPPPEGAGPTTIESLSEDLMLAIFLRLPSLAALVRAALARRSWRRAVASSPAFRRRFRAIHPPPLLGFFFQAPEPVQAPNLPAFPAFAPARPRDRDMSAAVRRGDFLLTSLQDRPDGEAPCWDMIDCRRGRCLLMNWDDALFVVLNPLIWGSDCTINFGLRSADFFEGSRGVRHPSEINARLVCSNEEDPASSSSFLLVLLALDDSRVRANVFSSDTGEWSVLPWVDMPAPIISDDDDESNCWLESEGGMQANGFLYWEYEDGRYLVSLDTATMEFSVAEIPQCLIHRDFDVGEAKDGTACIVYADQLSIGVLVRTRDDDGVESWVLDSVLPLGVELGRVLRAGLHDSSELMHLVDVPTELCVLAVRDGYAYLAASTNDTESPHWFLSLCLETMKLERLFRRTLDNYAHPYIMAWPPSLVGSYGKFALEDAP